MVEKAKAIQKETLAPSPADSSGGIITPVFLF